jgi:hypothetical protein
MADEQRNRLVHKQLRDLFATIANGGALIRWSRVQAKYRRICTRRGPMKALVAVERAMVVAAHGMLTTGDFYRALSGWHLGSAELADAARNLIKQATPAERGTLLQEVESYCAGRNVDTSWLHAVLTEVVPAYRDAAERLRKADRAVATARTNAQLLAQHWPLGTAPHVPLVDPASIGGESRSGVGVMTSDEQRTYMPRGNRRSDPTPAPAPTTKKRRYTRNDYH